MSAAMSTLRGWANGFGSKPDAATESEQKVVGEQNATAAAHRCESLTVDRKDVIDAVFPCLAKFEEAASPLFEGRKKAKKESREKFESVMSGIRLKLGNFVDKECIKLDMTNKIEALTVLLKESLIKPDLKRKAIQQLQSPGDADTDLEQCNIDRAVNTLRFSQVKLLIHTRPIYQQQLANLITEFLISHPQFNTDVRYSHKFLMDTFASDLGLDAMSRDKELSCPLTENEVDEFRTQLMLAVNPRTLALELHRQSMAEIHDKCPQRGVLRDQYKQNNVKQLSTTLVATGMNHEALKAFLRVDPRELLTQRVHRQIAENIGQKLQLNVEPSFVMKLDTQTELMSVAGLYFFSRTQPIMKSVYKSPPKAKTPEYKPKAEGGADVCSSGESSVLDASLVTFSSLKKTDFCNTNPKIVIAVVQQAIADCADFEELKEFCTQQVLNPQSKLFALTNKDNRLVALTRVSGIIREKFKDEGIEESALRWVQTQSYSKQMDALSQLWCLPKITVAVLGKHPHLETLDSDDKRLMDPCLPLLFDADFLLSKVPDNLKQAWLFRACATNNFPSIEVVVACGGEINGVSPNGDYPLHALCSNGHIKLLTKLDSEFIIDYSVRCADGKTALHLACECESEELVKMLLPKMSTESLDIGDREHSTTPLMTVAMNGHYQLAQQLLKSEKINPCLLDYHDRTALVIAYLNNKMDVFKLLLSHAALSDINCIDEDGHTLVMHAAKYIEEDSVDILPLILKRRTALKKLSPI